MMHMVPVKCWALLCHPELGTNHLGFIQSRINIQGFKAAWVEALVLGKTQCVMETTLYLTNMQPISALNYSKLCQKEKQ